MTVHSQLPTLQFLIPGATKPLRRMVRSESAPTCFIILLVFLSTSPVWRCSNFFWSFPFQLWFFSTSPQLTYSCLLLDAAPLLNHAQPAMAVASSPGRFRVPGCSPRCHQEAQSMLQTQNESVKQPWTPTFHSAAVKHSIERSWARWWGMLSQQLNFLFLVLEHAEYFQQCYAFQQWSQKSCWSGSDMSSVLLSPC